MKRLIVDLPTFGHCAVLTVNRAYPVYPVLPTFSSAVGISQTVREPTSQLAVILCNQSGMVPIPKRRVADMAARSRICSLKQQRLGHVQLTPQPASRRGNGRRHRPECSPKPECSRAISPSPPSSSLERDFCRRRRTRQKETWRRYLCAETGNRRPPHARNGRKNGFSAARSPRKPAFFEFGRVFCPFCCLSGPSACSSLGSM